MIVLVCMGICLRKMNSELKEFTRLIHVLVKKKSALFGRFEFFARSKRIGGATKKKGAQKQPEPSLQDSINGEGWDSHGSHVF